jgi:putative holliday junction resolvase
MRILGIDHGTRRIGLALSDELGFTAQPLPFVDADKPQRIAEIVRTRGVTKIVVGLPRNMDGSYGPSADAARHLVEQLKALVSVSIETWDERLTTSQANRVLIEGNVSRARRKEKIDSMAAQLLLQSYLDAHAQSSHEE